MSLFFLLVWSKLSQTQRRTETPGEELGPIWEDTTWSENDRGFQLDNQLTYEWMPSTPSLPVTTLMAGAFANGCRGDLCSLLYNEKHFIRQTRHLVGLSVNVTSIDSLVCYAPVHTCSVVCFFAIQRMLLDVAFSSLFCINPIAVQNRFFLP